MQRREFIMQSAGIIATAGAAGAAAAAAQQGHQQTVNPANNGSQVVATEVWPGKSFNGILSGKVAVVIGAARGIGRAIAVDFAANGADVVGIDIAGPVSPIVEYVPGHAKPISR